MRLTLLYMLPLALWCKTFKADSQTLTTSKLPIIVINTEGKPIVNEPKTDALMRIIYGPPGQMNSIGDSANIYEGHIGIEIRGNSSAWYPQTPYGVETRDKNGANRNVALFGWPAENDWTLLSNFNDRSLMRNLIAFNLFRAMGHYAPRARLAEVVLNGGYRGIYLFAEKVKRDKGRVNIAALEPKDAAGDALTGGYQFKVDYGSSNDHWVSNFPPYDYPGRSIHFIYVYPEPEALIPQQRAYLSDYVNRFETALFGANFRDTLRGYRAFIDVPSFIDYLIVQEVARNTDGFKKSSFFYKERDSRGGKIHAGPVWDFDWAFKHNLECPIMSAEDGSGFSHQINLCKGDLPAPAWFSRLLEDTAFANRANCRYAELRKGPLKTENLHRWMDSLAIELDAAQQRHFQRWRILGVMTDTPEPVPIPATYAQEVAALKLWLERRLGWLDRNMPGRCGPAQPPPEPPTNEPMELRPNPARTYVEVKNRPAAAYGYALYDVAGRQIRPRTWFGDDARIDLSDLPAGMYFVQALRADNTRIGATMRLVKN